jgi:hypothetical protein
MINFKGGSQALTAVLENEGHYERDAGAVARAELLRNSLLSCRLSPAGR